MFGKMADIGGQTSLRSKRFRCFFGEIFSFGRAKIGARTKKQKEGVGEGEKETLADKPRDFGNLRSSANGALDWCGLDRII